MIIHIAIYPDAEDERDCLPENMSYQASTAIWETAHQKLDSLRFITEKDAKAAELAEESETL